MLAQRTPFQRYGDLYADTTRRCSSCSENSSTNAERVDAYYRNTDALNLPKLNTSRILGVVNEYTDVTVWRVRQTTYFKGTDVFSASSRCGDTIAPPTDPITLMRGVLGALDHDHASIAVLSSSELFGTAPFHVVAEKFLPVAAARSVLQKNPSSVIIVDALTPLLLKYFALIGIPSTRLHVIAAHSRPIIVQKLYVPLALSCGLVPQSIVQSMREWIRDEHQQVYEAAHHWRGEGNIVVIDRVEGGRCNRCLSNTHSLVAALRLRYPSRRVLTLVAGDRPLTYILEILANTSYLVAPHGAGEVHMLLLPDNASVVEIANKRPLNRCFEAMSGSCRLNYFMARSLDESTADIDAVLAAMSEIEAHHRSGATR